MAPEPEETTEAETAAAPDQASDEPTATTEPTTEAETGDEYPHVESVGSGGEILVWECSEGDFVSRDSSAAVTAHIGDVHGDAPSTKRKAPPATSAPARQATRRARRR